MKAAWILAASALAMASCAKEEILAPEEESANKITVNITAGSIDTSNITAGSIDTRTHYDGTDQIKWDQAGETIELLENGIKFATATSDAGTTVDKGVTANFKAKLSQATGPFDYYAIYPSESYPTSNNSNLAEIKLEHKNVQNPTATSFDPKADLLVSKGVHLDAQPTNLSFQFARPIAIMEMTVKGLTDGEKITSVDFSSETAILSGRMKYNFTTDKVISYGYTNNEIKTITCNYTDYTAVNAGNKIYFTVFPTGTNPALADFTVTVTTDKATYTKSVTPPTALTIKPNELVKFSVSGLTRTASVTDKYDLLTDASQLGEGDKILIVADDAKAGTVAMASQAKDYRNDVQVAINTNNTITTLPDGIQIIELVNSQTPGEFMLRTSNNPILELEHHSNNNLYSMNPGSSWKIAVVNGKTEISTPDGNSTRYIKYNYNGGSNSRFSCYTSGQTDVKIFYKKGTPKTPLATPTGLTATVAEGTNVAQVSWTAVTDAASYTVTCGENVQTVNAPETSATISNLAWSTTHTIYVVANPAAGSATLKSSDAVTTDVTTGKNPNEVILLKEGDYVVMYATGTSYKGLTSTASKFNLKAADVAYDGLAQNVTATKDLIWHITYNSQQAAYSFFNAATGKYLILKVSGNHNNAGLGTEEFHELSAVEGAQNTFTIGADKKLFYKDTYTEFTFDGTAPTGTDHLLIIPAKADETPVISFESIEFIANAVDESLTIPFKRNSFATGDVTVTVATGADWLNVTSATIADPGTEIACTFAANTGAERTATLTVKVAGNEAEQTITVTQAAAGASTEKTETLTFGQHADFAKWGTGYTDHTLSYDDVDVMIAKSNKQNQTITDQPVTKGSPVTLSMKNGKILKKVSFVFKQWSSKTQTATLKYSTDGTTFNALTPSVTSSNFAITETTLPANTVAVQVTFSSSKNQIGITSATVTYE